MALFVFHFPVFLCHLLAFLDTLVPALPAPREAATALPSFRRILMVLPVTQTFKMHNFLVLLVSTLGLLMAWTRRVLPLLINNLSGVGQAMLFPQTAAAPSTLQSLSGICDCFACVDANGLLTISPHAKVRTMQQCGTPRAVAAPTPGPTFRTAPSPGSNSVWRPTAATHQTSPSAAGSSGRSRNVRQSGPPRSYGPPVGTANDFAETTPTLTTASVTVGILPKVRRLQAANLIFHVNVNESGPIFEELNAGFQKHCKDNKIVFITPAPVYSNDGELVSTPNTMPWILAGPKGRAGNRTWVEDPKSLTAFTFTVAALRASPYNNTPNHLSAGIFIFIACTRNAHCTVGPPDTDTRTPVEEFLAFTRPSETAESEDSDSDVEIMTRAAHRRQWRCRWGFHLLSVMDTAPTSVKPRSFNRGGLFDLTLRCIPGAGVNSLASWQSHMAEVHGMDSDGLNLNAHSVDCAARALITRFASPPAVKFKEVLQEQFPTPRPTVEGPFTDVALFGLRVQIGPGFGRGPRAEVLTQAIKILMADQLLWTDCGDFKSLRLHPSLAAISRRSATLKATGLIKGYHFCEIHTTPQNFFPGKIGDPSPPPKKEIPIWGSQQKLSCWQEQVLYL
ncbi:hypothetical protein B0H14DRAFT_2613567 [Mycena olivaceomarginata]|nr:hypothetical protein B0H14DRAFT_2613567 [Mycena olivaceomarginata]